MLSALLDKEMGELMEYRKLMKNPKYRRLYRDSYAKEIINSATSKGDVTSKVATANSGATSKGSDTPNRGSPSPTETFTQTGGPT